eukprot:CAMPEP_0194321560 /NCGR_PEP_ID=MMETSP0171-20130528/17763_1 /TAXON_ID=218684 /ORGANISM="Corethron pennatum, Strain L29A3" /LENGTH=43 /DNA_ID= /DNA_START= /DNA_END= /DNA_ORIENTATION=
MSPRSAAAASQYLLFPRAASVASSANATNAVAARTAYTDAKSH